MVCGGLRWFVVVCGGLWWFVVDCGGLSFSHTPDNCLPKGTPFTYMKHYPLISGCFRHGISLSNVSFV